MSIQSSINNMIGSIAQAGINFGIRDTLKEQTKIAQQESELASQQRASRYRTAQRWSDLNEDPKELLKEDPNKLYTLEELNKGRDKPFKSFREAESEIASNWIDELEQYRSDADYMLEDLSNQQREIDALRNRQTAYEQQVSTIKHNKGKLMALLQGGTDNE